jgi:uncharacterized membrane protein HdeD (DUF308 family)
MPRSVSREQAREVAETWWLFVFVGLASLIAGVILITKPSDSLATLAVIVGIFLLLDGIVELVESFGHDQENRALAAILGVLGIVVGIALVRHPFHGVAAVGILIGIWLVAAGVVRLVRAIVEGRRRVLRSAIALLEIVVGIVVVSDPHIGYATLAVLSGIWLILNGIGTIAFAIVLHSARAGLSEPSPSGDPVQ